VQFAGDTALAAALAVGQKRYFGVSMSVDWGRNNTFGDPLADMSEYILEATIERQLSGVIPDQMQATEGYSGAKMTVTLGGNLPDGTPLWKMFSPFAAYGTYADGGAVNTPMFLNVRVVKADGSVGTIRQFTGWVDTAAPSRANGTVTIICFDAVGQLENNITYYRWGANAYAREYRASILGTVELPETGTISACWLIDDILRKSGFYEGPAWHNAAMLAWTMRGSTLPSIGSINQERPTIYQDVWTFGAKIHNTPVDSPAMETPGEVWSKAQGKYGPAFKGINGLGLWRGGTRTYKTLHGSAQATTRYDVSSYGGLNSNLLGQSWWVYIDRSGVAGAPTSVTNYYLSDLQLNFSGGNQYPAVISSGVRHDLGTATLTVQSEGASPVTWTWSSTAMATGWHFVSWVARFDSGQVRASLWVDSIQQINLTTGGSTGSIGSLTYLWEQGTTNAAWINSEMPVQYVQWIQGPNQAIGTYVQPESTPPADPQHQASVDLAGQRLIWLPDINQQPAGDVVQSVVGAELGAFYVTELGVTTFDSRSTIKARQTSGAAVFDLTLDNLHELAPETTYLSVANVIGYAATVMVAVPYQKIYGEPKADSFYQAANITRTYPVTLTDVQSMRVGAVTWRPFAQGYDAGLTPPTLYYQNYMDYYKPDFWQDGFTDYVPNSRPSNGPPPVGGGMPAGAVPGFVDIVDQDPRHMRILVVNTSGGPMEYAVDDSTPFLNIAGTILLPRPSSSETVRDATSIARYKERIFNLPTDDWHQDILWLRSVGASLLADVKKPTTLFQQITTVGDPRVQLQDVCRIVDPDQPGAPGMTAATVAYGSVVGIKRTISAGGDGAQITDDLTIRTFVP
jgi:hypothetical protein